MHVFRGEAGYTVFPQKPAADHTDLLQKAVLRIGNPAGKPFIGASLKQSIMTVLYIRKAKKERALFELFLCLKR